MYATAVRGLSFVNSPILKMSTPHLSTLFIYWKRNDYIRRHCHSWYYLKRSQIIHSLAHNIYMRTCQTQRLCTVKPRLTVTSLVRSPHPFAVPNCIPQCNFAPSNRVTSPLRSLLPSPCWVTVLLERFHGKYKDIALLLAESDHIWNIYALEVWYY